MNRYFPDLNTELKVTLFAPNKREQRKAVVKMNDKDAHLVLEKGKVKVGLVSCKV